MAQKEQAAWVAELLQERGLSKKESLALLANIAVESGYTFHPAVAQKGNRKDPAKGVFQFDPRGKGLGNIYEEYKKDTNKTESLETQLDFIVDSIKGVYKKGTEYIGFGNVKNFNKAAKDPKVSVSDLTKQFSETILRPGKPHLDRRLQASVDYAPLVYPKETLEEKAKKANTFPESFK